MTAKAGISIKEICEHYTIKQSTAYKWKKVLEDLGLEIDWQNLDKIQNREINLSNPEESALVVSEATVEIAEIEEEAPQEIWGISRERLEEINAVVQLEVHVEETLRNHHRAQIQQQRKDSVNQKFEEVKNLDPLELIRQVERLTKKVS